LLVKQGKVEEVEKELLLVDLAYRHLDDLEGEKRNDFQQLCKGY